MLMTINNWIAATFAEGSRPHYNTVLKWVAAKKIEHTRIAGTIYIKADATPVIATPHEAVIARIAGKM